jgi:hypothetical protein
MPHTGLLQYAHTAQISMPFNDDSNMPAEGERVFYDQEYLRDPCHPGVCEEGWGNNLPGTGNKLR